jgi:hypothetical protein
MSDNPRSVIIACPHGVDRRFTRCLMCQPETEVESVLLESRPIRYRITGTVHDRLAGGRIYEVDLIAEPVEEDR